MQLELTDIPKVPLPTVMLDLRFNKIKDITPGSFKGHKVLRSLLLNNNLLTSLKNGIFTGLVQLRHLYLYKNRIKYIESEVFQGLPKLEHLYLHNNELKEFKYGTFSNIPHLDRLFLYNNHISHIPAGAFQNLPKLTRLRLDQNALVCDCRIAWFAKMLNDNTLHVAANCRYPDEMYGKPLKGMSSTDFHCKAPEIMEGPQDIEVSWGSTAIFTCKVSGDPKPSIFWMRNDEEIALDSTKYTLMENGSLLIRNTEDSDSGHYECMAKNSDGEVKSRAARMILVRPEQHSRNAYGSPVFLVMPVGVTTSEAASEINLHCKAVGNPHPTITWSLNGVQLTSSERHFIDRDGTLIIRPVKASDHGTYRCDATNDNGRISAIADVIINVAPVFTAHPQNIDTDIGSTVKLECVAVGSPPPEITWFKDDLEVRSDGRIFISEDGSYLEIRNAKESDSALYICEARNHIGFREVSAKVKVTSLSRKPPTFVYKPYNIETLVGSTIELPCKAQGDPTPGIQWQKDGASLQRTGRTKVSLTGNLYIYSVVPEDQGRYECTAINDFGRNTASCYVTVKENQNPTNFGIGDKFVKIAFVEASQEVDKAINKTIDNLVNNRGPHSSAELFRLIRFPDAPARELARAAEVYERTLVNIRKHVREGMRTNSTTDFNYREILSPDHLNLVAELSGCMTHRFSKNCTDMCFHSKYRTIDGTCNNLQHPMWGASLTGFRRILKPIYENGFSTPVGWNKETKYYGYSKPSSRLVSTTLIATSKITSDKEITHMVMQWGQFLDHDLDHAIPSVSSESWDGIDCKKSCEYAAPCYPMDVPPNDPRITNRRCIDFVRSSAICGSGMTSVFFDNIQPREQINQLTSYIDASQVYGYSEELSRDLRDLNGEGGRLREGAVFAGRKPLLPYAGNQGVDCRRNLSESTINCFVAGDIRANEQAGLIAMHTLWMREHNRIARKLKSLNPHWDGDMVYHEARKIVGASMQHITYKHWLPFIIGPEGMQLLGEYKGYEPTINPSISNVFATAALRFGHTLINPVLHRFDWDFKPIREGHLPLHKAFFSPWRVVDEGGIDPLLRGLFAVPAKLKKPDENLNTELTEQLFKSAHAVALDLAAMNIHRSRDHAIPGYIEFRKYCNMTQVDSFDDLKNEITDRSVLRKLQELYGHPGNIDVWVGGVLEDQVEGGRIGPLFRCLLIEQFRRLRDGDRFYYENPSVFKPEQLVQIKQYSLSRVICDNGDNITRTTKNSFILPELQGGYIQCENIPEVDLSLWSECCSDCRYSGQLNTISRLNARNRRHLDDFTYKNSTATENYIEENRKLKRKMLKMEKDLHSMKETVQQLERVIKKLERQN
jgi:peroxidase